MFACLIEISRKQTLEVKMTFSNFGTISLYKNREIGFQNNHGDYQDTASVMEKRAIPLTKSQLDESLSMIDGASAILS
jgi:hypothetical protein